MEQKTKQERLSEVIMLLKKIYDFGFDKRNKDILQFQEILTQWMNDGQFRKGVIYLHGYERKLIYELYSRKNMEIEICLKYKKGI